MRVISTIVLLVWTIVLQAQTGSYLEDLATLKSILQKTPSYKDQIQGDKLAAYNALYARLVADTTGNITGYKYFYNLAQLVFPLKDNHLGFYQVSDYSNFKNKDAIENYIKTAAFSAYPSYEIDIDSLKAAMAQKPFDSIEGIYHYDKFYSVGLFKSGDKEYTGVVLDSDINLWQKGQVAMHLYEYKPRRFKAIYGHPLFKNFLLQPNEKYNNQSLLNSYFYSSYSQNIYSKRLPYRSYADLPKNAQRFELKNINDKVQYLLLRSFQATASTMQRSKIFYDSIKNLLKAPNLVLDLRNNEGGAKKQAGKYFKLLKKYSKKGKLYVLVNNETISQAEIFTLRLKKVKNVVTIGQTTKGMLAYGSNYGKRERLPGQKVEIYITDMRGKPEYLRYEDEGISPDIYLDDRSDWIDQTLQILGM